MSALIRWAAEKPLLALLFGALVAAAGVLCGLRLPIDAVPDVTNVQVQVVTRAPSLSALEVETQVTQPVERAMAGTPGLRETRSITKLGISIVTLVFRDNVDVYQARTQVSERLVSVRDSIPAEVGRPELGPISTALGEIYMFELRPEEGHKRSSEELRTIVDWQIGPKLRQVPGVIEVVGFGGAAKQYRVTLDPSRLSAHGISPEEVRAALLRDNRLSGGGFIERAGEQVVLRGDAVFRGLEDIAGVVVRSERGVPIRVGQLGAVDTGPALRQGAMTRDARGEIVGASVLMLKGENSREVVANVKASLEELRPFLPAGVRVDPYYDRAEFIDRVLGTVAKNLGEGALIVVLCLLVTLGSLRAGLLVAGAIPFSLLVGLLGLYALGYSGNVMSLGAIDFGIIVEGAVVAIEHALGHGAQVPERGARRAAIADAMAHVARPAIFGVVITLLVFLPLATLEDVEGKMFRPVVYSLSFMLFGSLLYTFVVLPALAPVFLRGPSGEPWFARASSEAYAPLLGFSLRKPGAAVALAFATTAALLAVSGGLGADFLPRVFEGTLAIDTLRPPSTALGQAIALSGEAERALRAAPEVTSVVSRIGRPEGAVDPAGPESSDVFITLKPRSEWRPGLTPETLVEDLSRRVNAAAPATLSAFSQPIEMRVNDLVAGVRSDVAIKVFGDDLQALSAAADAVRRTVSQIPGAADVKMEVATGLPAIQVRVRREQAGRVGVAPGQVLDVLAMARAGVPAGVVREGERVFDLTLRLGGDSLASAADLARLPIATQGGELVPLSMVAGVSEEDTVVQIGREQMRRRLVVSSNVRGRDVVSFVKEAQARVGALKAPRGVEIVWGGQFQSFNRAKDRLILLVPVAMLVIGVMLVIAYGSLAYTAVTMLNLPFALAGGAAALWMRGLPFSIPAGVGFIALAGVAVLTGLVMTTALLAAPTDLPPEERVRRSVLSSLRAPLSTALTAAVGFIPAAIATGTGAEVQRPLATVVIGGLLIGTALSLLALPAMLLAVARRRA